MASLFRFAIIALIAIILVGKNSQALAQSSAQATELTVDPKISRVYVLVDKKRLGHSHAVEGNLKSGQLTLGAKSEAGQLVFDITSFVADTETARKYCELKGEIDENTQKKVNDNMLGEAVLDAEKFPTATFDIESSLLAATRTSKGRRQYELKGKFTLHGVTHPLTVVAETEPSGATTRLRGKFRVLQTDYGIKPYTAALGAIGVADELTIWGEIDLKP